METIPIGYNPVLDEIENKREILMLKNADTKLILGAWWKIDNNREN